MSLILKIFRFCLQLFYYILWIFPVKNQLVMISRQSNKPSLDFQLLKEEIEGRNDPMRVVMLCRTLDGGVHSSIFTKIGYAFHMVQQLYYLSTSKVVILDGYCIVVSLLKHKKSLHVIQMWHSMGSMKKFGYTALDQEEGSSSKLAFAMHMHENYEYFFASSMAYVDHLASGFHCDVSHAKIFPLPRYDRLIDQQYQKQKAEEIYEKYPQLKDKKVIIYCPTFRKDESEMLIAYKKLEDCISDDCILVSKLHPLSKIVPQGKRVMIAPEFSTVDMFSVADYVISDYSCVVYEAAILNIPLAFYPFDLDLYKESRGLAIDYENELPGIISKNPQVIMDHIKNDSFDLDELQQFKHKYIHNTLHASKDIVDFIESIKDTRRG